MAIFARPSVNLDFAAGPVPDGVFFALAQNAQALDF
jgi:hypothetical protein